jgi:hypothetical protein
MIHRGKWFAAYAGRDWARLLRFNLQIVFLPRYEEHEYGCMLPCSAYIDFSIGSCVGDVVKFLPYRQKKRVRDISRKWTGREWESVGDFIFPWRFDFGFQ